MGRTALVICLLRVKMIVTSKIHRHRRAKKLLLTDAGFYYDRCMLRSWPMQASVKKRAIIGGYYE